MTDATQRSEHAHRIMTDELVLEAFATIENDLVDLWKGSSERDGEGRERVYRMIFAMRTFKTFFESVMAEGQLHQHQLQQLKRGHLS